LVEDLTVCGRHPEQTFINVVGNKAQRVYPSLGVWSVRVCVREREEREEREERATLNPPYLPLGAVCPRARARRGLLAERSRHEPP